MQDLQIGPGHDTPPPAPVPWRAGRGVVMCREGRAVETAAQAQAPRGRLTGERDRPPETEPPMGRTCIPPGSGRETERRSERRALPDLERALINPAAVFPAPHAVLDHPGLLRPVKHEILRRWAWDEYLKEVAAAEGMAEGEPSRLDAVKVALLSLGETWRPHPAAPAAAIPVPAEPDPTAWVLAAAA
jgi:hypothetical protein